MRTFWTLSLIFFIGMGAFADSGFDPEELAWFGNANIERVDKVVEILSNKKIRDQIKEIGTPKKDKDSDAYLRYAFDGAVTETPEAIGGGLSYFHMSLEKEYWSKVDSRVTKLPAPKKERCYLRILAPRQSGRENENKDKIDIEGVHCFEVK